VLVNGEDLLPEKCKEIRNEFMIGESGAFYGLVPQDDGFKVFKPTSDAAYFVPGCDRLYVNTKGSVRYYTSLSTSDRIFVGDTNVGEPVKTEAVGRQYYLLDKRGSLYLLDLSGSTLEKALIAEDVADIRWSESNVLEFESKKDGTVNEIVQIAYSSLGYQMHWSALDLDVGSFYIPDIQSETVTENDAVISYFIDKNKELRFRFQDETAGLTSVNCGICSTYDPETESGLIWFVREDGSIWYYDLKEKAWNEAALPAEETVSGDLNGDGRRSVADAVILCKYLCGDLAALPQWHTVDMDKNGILTAADLTLLKRELMK
jgi:hypothetical protein